MRYPVRPYEMRWSPARCQGWPDFELKVGDEAPVKVTPTRRATALLVTAAAALVLVAALIEVTP